MAGVVASGRIQDRVQRLLLSAVQRRCRLQGLQDASLHFGWVVEVAGDTILIDVKSKRAINPGGFMYLEVSAPKSMVTFVAQVKELHDSAITLQICSEVEIRSLKSESRVRTKAFEGEIGAPGSTSMTQCTVVDVSENGFGFISKRQVEVTGPCSVVLQTVHGEINLTGNVRHARNDKDLAAYRGGVQIMDMDRISRARWVRIIEG